MNSTQRVKLAQQIMQAFAQSGQAVEGERYGVSWESERFIVNRENGEQWIVHGTARAGFTFERMAA